LMDRDTTTRTGARTPGAEGRLVSRTAVFHPSPSPTQSGTKGTDLESTKGADKPNEAKRMPGARLKRNHVWAGPV
jgi:hypothetical protein